METFDEYRLTPVIAQTPILGKRKKINSQSRYAVNRSTMKALLKLYKSFERNQQIF